MTKSAFLLALSTLLLPPVSQAQQSAGLSQQPAFDAASVKLAGPEVPQPWTITGGPGKNDPGRFRAPRTSLSYLIPRAFGVSVDQIIGPEWLHDPFGLTTFTVVATMPPDITNEQFRAMLRNLIVELSSHSRDTSSFILDSRAAGSGRIGNCSEMAQACEPARLKELVARQRL
jgi:hypothetical protein